MGVLSSQQIRAMLSDTPPLVAGFLDLDEQLQANGFDMTLESIAGFTGAGQDRREQHATASSRRRRSWRSTRTTGCTWSRACTRCG